MWMSAALTTLLAAAMVGQDSSGSAPPPVERQVREAVMPAPEAQRAGATVLGYASDGALVALRAGTGDMICLADDPADPRFHVACYFKTLDPFMARGRALRAEGKDRAAIDSTRAAEIEAGTLSMPREPTALFSLTAPADSVDAATGEVRGAAPLYVVYMPYATEESTGITTTPGRGVPWLMFPGKPWAHIMVIP
jgi:hypothetical protein